MARCPRHRPHGAPLHAGRARPGLPPPLPRAAPPRSGAHRKRPPTRACHRSAPFAQTHRCRRHARRQQRQPPLLLRQALGARLHPSWSSSAPSASCRRGQARAATSHRRPPSPQRRSHAGPPGSAAAADQQRPRRSLRPRLRSLRASRSSAPSAAGASSQPAASYHAPRPAGEAARTWHSVSPLPRFRTCTGSKPSRLTPRPSRPQRTQQQLLQLRRLAPPGRGRLAASTRGVFARARMTPIPPSQAPRRRPEAARSTPALATAKPRRGPLRPQRPPRPGPP